MRHANYVIPSFVICSDPMTTEVPTLKNCNHRQYQFKYKTTQSCYPEIVKNWP